MSAQYTGILRCTQSTTASLQMKVVIRTFGVQTNTAPQIQRMLGARLLHFRSKVSSPTPKKLLVIMLHDRKMLKQTTLSGPMSALSSCCTGSRKLIEGLEFRFKLVKFQNRVRICNITSVNISYWAPQRSPRFLIWTL